MDISKLPEGQFVCIWLKDEQHPMAHTFRKDGGDVCVYDTCYESFCPTIGKHFVTMLPDPDLILTGKAIALKIQIRKEVERILPKLGNA